MQRTRPLIERALSVGAVFAAASGLLLGLLLCAPAMAGNWVVCDARIQVTAHRGERLQAEVVQVLPGRGSGCFQRGDVLDFAPETPDYQRMLPRRSWPRPGELATLRYRSLTGFCKGDGFTRPCTIEHHSILRQPRP